MTASAKFCCFALGSCLGVWCGLAQELAWEIEALGPDSAFVYDPTTGQATGTNGVVVRYDDALLTAQRVTVNQTTGDAEAEGTVRIQRGTQIWAGERLRYNFFTREIEAATFRTGEGRVFAAGEGLYADPEQGVYFATNALITAEDHDPPGFCVHSRRIKIVPGQYVEARNATLYAGTVPVMFLPYYRRSLELPTHGFSLTPGYRSRFGPFLLGTYDWQHGENWDGSLHLDYRLRRGVGAGADANYRLGRLGDGQFHYYYLNDERPGKTDFGESIDRHRHRVRFAHSARPATNWNLLAVARYQTDADLLRDFFESEYRQNPSPNTFVEVSKFWDNFSLNLLAQPRLNDFLESVERLPDIKLVGFRQPIGPLPLFYESESSVGYYRRRFIETNFSPNVDYGAARADTFHQVVLPLHLLGWLQVSPRVAGRFGYYGAASGDGGTTEEHYRAVFSAGNEVSFKALRTWPALESRWLELDGLRHVIEPSANYVYIPRPNVRPEELPQFDYLFPNLRLTPLEFPDFQAVDAIDSQNTIRWGLRNKLQTKRHGQVCDFADWLLFADWRLNPRRDQRTWSDLYSSLRWRPRSWWVLDSEIRFHPQDAELRLTYHAIQVAPTSTWSWRLGHLFVSREVSEENASVSGFRRPGNNSWTSDLSLQVSENWSFRVVHLIDAKAARLQEQSYTLYRDWRSWTAGLTFRARDYEVGDEDYTVAFTISLKAFPRSGRGHASLFADEPSETSR